MRSDSESVISDSEPECAIKRIASKKEDTTRSGRRRTSDERPGLSTGEAEGREVEKDRVVVLSSASEGEEPARRKAKSGYLSSTAGKRRRVPSPTAAPDQWTAAAAPVSSTSRETGSRSSRSTSAEQPFVSAPFVSALDLLRSSTPQLSDSDDDLKPLDIEVRRNSYKEKAKAKATVSSRLLPTVKKTRSASISSVEILDTAPSKSNAARKSKTLGAASTDDVARSIRSSSTSDSLPPPDTWKERFGSGSKSVTESERLSVEPTSQPQRKKPWEELEAKPPKAKRKTAARKAAQPAAPKQEAEEEVDELDSDPDGLVISSFKLTSVTSSFTSARPVVRRVTASSLSFLPPPMELPPDDRLRALTACVICKAAWPASKALASRQTHTRTCSTANDYSAETVRYLVDSQILRLAEEADGKRRADEEAKTLFDMAVGKGEGANAFKEVKVVGVEGYAGDDPKEWYRAIKETQDEFDQARRKAQVARVVKLAKQVKKERAEVAASSVDDGWKVVNESAGVEKEEEDEVVPLPTGRLKPDSSTARNAVASRADAMLAFDASVPHSVLDSDTSGDDPPRPTQSFEPSRLTSRYDMPANPIDPLMTFVEHSDRTTISGTPSRRRSRSPFRPLSLPDPFSDSDDGEGHHGRRRSASGKQSLWSVAAGRNDELLGKVVCSVSPICSPSRRSPTSPALSPASSARLSTLTLSSLSPSPLRRPALAAPSPPSHSSRSLHSSPPSPGRKGTDEAAEAMRTLGLSSPSLAKKGRRRTSGTSEDELLVGVVSDVGSDVMLEGGAGDGGQTAVVSSSEEEPLAKVVAATPRRRKTPASPASSNKARARRVAPPSSSDDEAFESTTPTKRRRPSPSIAKTAAPLPVKTAATADMPDYDKMTVAALQREVAKFGFRKAKEKAVLVRQMQEIWKATHAGSGEGAASAVETDAASPKKSKVIGKGKKGVSTASPPAKTATKGRRKKQVDLDGDEAHDPDATDEGGISLAEKIRQLIMADEQLYLRILRYEPVHLSEFIRLAADNGVKIAKAALMRCLDEQSITHYSQDPTGGSRRRYK
ncbi:RHTO0S27e00760g2_1 [Rhodotorula toruloides]|uniref:Structure-specific endonuclease subunit SLX4 n=2 Tax=Rhodotorula toruloides TaxID=5286 RepID=A0A061BND0_RHOTO|nr:RHTO0S27e00760g2_1 [Rhodotorula toruloides]